MSSTPPLLSEIQARWSPRAFRAEALSAAQLESLLEAARWAPSCRNEQPWRFLVFGRDNAARTQIESYLTGGNYWAKAASHLVVVCTLTHFDAGSGDPNRHGFYDAGAAAMALSLQAQHLGIAVHQMAGFDYAQLTQDLRFPDHAKAVAMMAIGFQSDDLSALSAKHQQVEQGPRQRKTLEQLSLQDTLDVHGLF